MGVPRYTACGGTRHEREGRELRIYLPFAPSDRAAIVSRGRAFCRPQLSLIPCGIRHERVGKSENVILPFAPSDTSKAWCIEGFPSRRWLDTPCCAALGMSSSKHIKIGRAHV